MTLADELREALTEINALIAGRKEQHERSPWFPPDAPKPSIYAVVDMNGKPVLGDLLATKANLLIALANLAGDTP